MEQQRKIQRKDSQPSKKDFLKHQESLIVLLLAILFTRDGYSSPEHNETKTVTTDTEQLLPPLTENNLSMPIKTLDLTPIESSNLQLQFTSNITTQNINPTTATANNDTDIEVNESSAGGISIPLLLVIAGVGGAAAAMGSGGGENGSTSSNTTSTTTTTSEIIFKHPIIILERETNDNYKATSLLVNNNDTHSLTIDNSSLFSVTPSLTNNELSFTLADNIQLFDSSTITLTDSSSYEHQFSIINGYVQSLLKTSINSQTDPVTIELPLDDIYTFSPNVTLYVSTNNSTTSSSPTGSYTITIDSVDEQEETVSGELTTNDNSNSWLWSNDYYYDRYDINLSDNGSNYDVSITHGNTEVYSSVNQDILEITLSPETMTNPYMELVLENNNVFIGFDPMISEQWHLFFSNIPQVWSTTSGENITIAVVEGLLQENHVDLSNNISSIENLATSTSVSSHATNVGGVIAATGSNGIGVIGVAPDADIVSISYNADGLFTYENDIIDIYSNSWGPYDNGSGLSSTFSYYVSQAQQANSNNDIVVFANGNGGNYNENSTFDALANSPYTLSINAVNYNGDANNYSEMGSNIVASAYSNSDISGFKNLGITTTEPSHGYTDSFGGTSSAAPLASGIIALMLAQNGDLNQRDVTNIFANTALKTDFNSDSWDTNLAGIDTSNQYGFGLLNAAPIIEAVENESYTISDHELLLGSLTIEDGTAALISSMESSFVEQITLSLNDIGYNSGHQNLDIILTHAAGNDSFSSTFAFNTTTSSDQDYISWPFNSTEFWGESIDGSWDIEITDSLNNNSEITDFSADLMFYYHDGDITIA